MTCLPPHAANAATLWPHMGSRASMSAAPAPQPPTCGYAALAIERSRACTSLSKQPTSRVLLGRVQSLTHLMLAIEVRK